ncbi:MAG: flagellar hook-associated protein FlgK [Spirochaetales bacterium]|nr:flagellar hook-associated protein FlgK [Spirochaetales bacterium]
MQSTFTGIEIGKRSLIAHTTSLQTVGHNLSNASVEGYSRQRVNLKAFDPLYMPQLNREMVPGQIGQGVDVQSIERVHDQILEGRIVAQANGRGYWEARDKYILMVEQVYNEPTESSVRTLMDKFWDSWQEMSLYPQEIPARESVLERGQALMDGIHRQYTGLKTIRDMIETDVTATVERTNAILSDLVSLSDQIVKVKALGDNPNDLLDQRDRLVKELSGLLNITVDNRDPDEFNIHTGGLHLLQGKVANYLVADPDPANEGYSVIRWRHNNEELMPGGGKLRGLLDLRDGDVRLEIQKLDMMSVNFMDMVNENHRAGFGLNGETGVDFFTEVPFVTDVAGNYDRNGDGEFDSTYVFRITGSNQLGAQDHIGLAGTMTLAGPQGNIAIQYFPTDTVEDVVKRINLSGSEVVARLDRDGRLQLKGTPAAAMDNPDFVIRHVEDSGQFLRDYAGILQASGPEGAYTWETANAVDGLQSGAGSFAVAPVAHPAGWIEMNSRLVNNPTAIAGGFGVNGRPAGPGDGSTALAIANLRHEHIMLGSVPTFDEYFAAVVADVGLKGETAQRTLETENMIMKDLEDTKEAYSGVNIDEELSEMIKFQHGYTAAARFITEVTKMIDTLINRVGA